MNVAFFGTPTFAVPSLDLLNRNKKFNVVCVVTQPDRPSGRGGHILHSPVKQYALLHNIPVLQPEKINENISLLDKFEPDVIIVVAFGQILRKNVLEYCKFGAINVHASLLPKYRGSSPIQWSIINGESKTGVTIMQMDSGVDTGDILHQVECEIAPNETSESLSVKLAKMGAEALVETLYKIKNGKAERKPQKNVHASFCPMLSKLSGRINWKLSANEISNMVRGMYPWPIAWFLSGDTEVRVHASTPFTSSELKNLPFAEQLKTQPFSVGAVVHASSRHGLFVNCRSGVLRLDVIQLPGGKPVACKDFLNGRTFAIGTGFN